MKELCTDSTDLFGRTCSASYVANLECTVYSVVGVYYNGQTVTHKQTTVDIL
jgi:hypothetical protein